MFGKLNSGRFPFEKEGYLIRELKKIPRTIVDYPFRRYRETRQNKTKNMAVRPKATVKSRRQFHKSHQLRWQKADCSKHHCITEPMSRKNLSTSTVRRTSHEAGLYGRITAKKPLLRKQNNVKKLQWAKVHKDWTILPWNKPL